MTEKDKILFKQECQDKVTVLNKLLYRLIHENEPDLDLALLYQALHRIQNSILCEMATLEIENE